MRLRGCGRNSRRVASANIDRGPPPEEALMTGNRRGKTSDPGHRSSRKSLCPTLPDSQASLHRRATRECRRRCETSGRVRRSAAQFPRRPRSVEGLASSRQDGRQLGQTRRPRAARRRCRQEGFPGPAGSSHWAPPFFDLAIDCPRDQRSAKFMRARQATFNGEDDVVRLKKWATQS